MANGGLMDKLLAMPKEKRMLVLAIGIIPVIGLFVYFGFFSGKENNGNENVSISIDMPDGENDDYDRSRLQTYKETQYGSGSSGSYWDSLGEENESDAGTDPVSVRRYSASELSPTIYSQKEIYDIVSGKRTKEEVDEEHALKAALAAKQASSEPVSRPAMTQAQRDSAYFARMERAYQLAQKYAPQQDVEAEAAVPVSEEAPEQEERRIDLSVSSVSGSVDGDGIITSLMGPETDDVVHYAGTLHSKPVKATFLKNETISNGQRVIIRLMQELVLSDGTIIPANTHITGTCTFSSRLMIDIKMLHYNGRMFPTDISVYDNDGTEGIYCPTVESSEKKKKKAQKIAGDVASGLGSTIGALITGTPFIGSVTRSGFQAATSAINDDGSVSVNVMSGYEFYVFENVKEK